MLGWEVFVYRQGVANRENLLAHWLSSSVGIDWIELLVKEGKVQDKGGNGYPCIYRGRADCLLPVVAAARLPGRYPPSLLPREAVFPNDFSAIEWNLALLRDCPPQEELLVHALDRS